MIQPVSLFIGLRYTRAKRRSHFVSFISLVSMLVIALGVAVLITVLSVFNGFDEEIRHRIFGLETQVAVNSFSPSGIAEWQSIEHKVKQNPKVVAVAPFVRDIAVATNQGMVQPVVSIGVDPDKEKNVTDLGTKMVSGSFDALKQNKFGAVIGQKLAANLDLDLGDSFTLMTTESSVTPVGVIPRYKTFKIVGIFHVGGGFKLDSGAVFMGLHAAQILYKLGNNVSGLRVKVPDLYDAPKVSEQLNSELAGGEYYASNWTEEFGQFFRAVRIEKNMMFIILAMIIVVAAFNLVSSLVMVVNDKRSEIAILRTLGASPGTIMRTFMVQGTVIGFIGILLGLIGGLLLAYNVTPIVNGLQKMLGTSLITESVYFGLDYLPSKVELSDVLSIILVAFAMSLLATVYPAWSASRTQPAQALRYE